MDKTTRLLIKTIKKEGAPFVSNILGHSDTQKVKRWAKNEKIPEPSVWAVDALFKAKGVE